MARTLSTTQNNLISVPIKSIDYRLGVQVTASFYTDFRASEKFMFDGDYYIDLTSVGEINWIADITETNNIDNTVANLVIKLFREHYLLSLSPYKYESKFNDNASPTYEPLLNLNRKVCIMFRYVPEGVSLAVDDYENVFIGRIQSIDWGGDRYVSVTVHSLECVIRDMFMESSQTYGGTSKLTASVSSGATTLNLLTSSVFSSGDIAFLTEGETGESVVVDGITSSTAITIATGLTTSYSSDAVLGLSLENEMYAVLSNNNLSSISVYAPVSPDWALYEFDLEQQSVYKVLDDLAKEIGWNVKYKYDNNSSRYRLTVFEPERKRIMNPSSAVSSNSSFVKVADTSHFSSGDNIVLTEGVNYDNTTIDSVSSNQIILASNTVNSYSTVATVASYDWVYEDEDYFSVESAALNLMPIRNVIKVKWVDDSAPSSAQLKSLIETSDASITDYGRRYMEFTEGSVSQINSSIEAKRLAEAALSDLEQSKIEERIEIPYNPYIEIDDVVWFKPNYVHFDTQQVFAVTGYIHRLSRSKARTNIDVRGKPSGGFLSWHSRAKKPGADTTKNNISKDTSNVNGTPSSDYLTSSETYSYVDQEIANIDLSSQFASLQDEIDQFSDDGYLTLAESNALAQRLNEIQAEDDDLIAVGSTLGAPTSSYVTAIGDLSSFLTTSYINQLSSLYPIAIPSSDRTEMQTRFETVNNYRSHLVNAIIEERQILAQTYADDNFTDNPVYAGAGTPPSSLNSSGATWINTNTGRPWISDGSSWTTVTWSALSSDPNVPVDRATRNDIVLAASMPASSLYSSGDLFVNSGNGLPYIHTGTSWAGTTWEAIRDLSSNAPADNATPNDFDTYPGTGAGGRVVINSGGFHAYNASSEEVVTIGSTSGYAYFKGEVWAGNSRVQLSSLGFIAYSSAGTNSSNAVVIIGSSAGDAWFHGTVEAVDSLIIPLRSSAPS